jgi:hypothetical protein
MVTSAAEIDRIMYKRSEEGCFIKKMRFLLQYDYLPVQYYHAEGVIEGDDVCHPTQKRAIVDPREILKNIITAGRYI